MESKKVEATVMDNMARKIILDKLKLNLSETRYRHTLGVEETAIEMARIFGVDEGKASLAALLHDCAKELEQEELIHLAKDAGWPIGEWEMKQPSELLHAPASACLAAKVFGVTDKEVLEAIEYHTLGNEHMSPLAMIIFVADMIEPNRSFPGVENLRHISFNNLVKGILACLEHTLEYLNNKNIEVHPQTSKTYHRLKNKYTDD